MTNWMDSFNEFLHPQQSATAPLSKSGFKAINVNPSESAGLQNNQDNDGSPKTSAGQSIYKGNYIRPIEHRANLEPRTVQMPLTNPVPAKTSKQSKPSTAQQPPPMGGRTAKQTLKRDKALDALKASARPLSSFAPKRPVAISPGASINHHKITSVPQRQTANVAGKTPQSISNAKADPISQVAQNRPETHQASERSQDDVRSDLPEQRPRMSSAELFVSQSINTQESNDGNFRFLEDDNDPMVVDNDENKLHNTIDEPMMVEDDSSDMSEDEFEVEAIRKHKFEKRELMLYVKWKNYSEKDNSWLSEAAVEPGAGEILQAYYDSIGGRPEPRGNVGRPRKQLVQTRAPQRKDSGEYQYPSRGLNERLPWSPPPVADGSWEHLVLSIDHFFKDGERFRAGITWITEDNMGNKYRTRHNYWDVRQAAPGATLKYLESLIMFEDTVGQGMRMPIMVSSTNQSTERATATSASSKRRRVP